MTNEERQVGVAALWLPQSKTLRFAPAHEVFEDAAMNGINGKPPLEMVVNVFPWDELPAQSGLLANLFATRFNVTVLPEVMDRRRWQELSKATA